MTKIFVNRKPNWKISVFLYAPFLLLFLLIIPGGVIGAGISAILAYIPVYLIIKLFKIDPNVYYNHNGTSITKEEYEKLPGKVEYGFDWSFEWLIKKFTKKDKSP